jgi:hypothetical protein
MKRYFFLTLFVVVAFAAELQAQNTIRFSGAFVQPGDRFSVDIVLENQSLIGGFVIPFRWSSPYVLFDSVTFVPDRVGGSPNFLLRQVLPEQRIAGIVMVPFPAADSSKPYVAPGSGPVARAFFRIAPNAIDEVAFIDSAHYVESGSLEARVELSTYNGITLHPIIVPGIIRIGNPAPATITAFPASLMMIGETGGLQPSVASLEIRSGDGNELDWEANWSSSWLDVVPSIGKTPAFPAVSADAFFLIPGTYYDTLVIISAIAENAPLYIPVEFFVDTAGARPPDGFNFTLGQNRPSPFVAYRDPETRIPFLLEEASHVDIAVYDILGRNIRILASSQYGAGEASVFWDGRDGLGVDVASGHYICRMITSTGVQSRVIVLIR